MRPPTRASEAQQYYLRHNYGCGVAVAAAAAAAAFAARLVLSQADSVPAETACKVFLPVDCGHHAVAVHLCCTV